MWFSLIFLMSFLFYPTAVVSEISGLLISPAMTFPSPQDGFVHPGVKLKCVFSYWTNRENPELGLYVTGIICLFCTCIFTCWSCTFLGCHAPLKHGADWLPAWIGRCHILQGYIPELISRFSAPATEAFDNAAVCCSPSYFFRVSNAQCRYSARHQWSSFPSFRFLC